MTQPAASSSSALPLTVDALTAELVLLYAQAEQQILVSFAHIVESTEPALLLSALRREAERIVADIRVQSWPLAQRVAVVAAQRGDEAALGELRRVSATSELLSHLLLDDPAVALGPTFGTDLGLRLNATLPRILQFADDAYRAATIDQAVHDATHGVTSQIAQRTAWRRLTERGITGFTDRTGRQWNLSTYVEMATRTGTQRAFNAAHLQRMVQAGVEQFTVPSDGHPCPLCKPWQGKVLTVDGPGPTIAQATLAGLFHPNCRHTLVAYFPGVSKFAAPSPWTDADQRAYDATQRLRSLERDVRAQKRAGAAALTPMDRKRAERRVRATQSEIRAHVDEHGLNRRPQREQLNLGNDAGGGAPPEPPKPPTSGGGGEPPDDWAARQAALGIETHGETLTPHEIEFVERFKALGHDLEWIPRSTVMRPTNDFLWLDNGSIPMELKTIHASYDAIHGRLVDATSRAAKHGFVKDNFVIDIGDAPLTTELAGQLAGYNVGRRKYLLGHLWVMAQGQLTEIVLR